MKCHKMWLSAGSVLYVKIKKYFQDIMIWKFHPVIFFNPLPYRHLFNTFANRADPDQAALVRMPDQGLLCLLMEIHV